MARCLDRLLVAASTRTGPPWTAETLPRCNPRCGGIRRYLYCTAHETAQARLMSPCSRAPTPVSPIRS
jgi:hypothetical protein